MFSVSGKRQYSMITYDGEKVIAQMSQSSVFYGADPECWQIRIVYFRPADTQDCYSDLFWDQLIFIYFFPVT